MDIRIFEDQTGFMMFPEKSLYKDTSIVRLFDNKIDLYIKKMENSLTVYCYILVHRGQERAIGCYIIGEDKFTDDTFTNFKNDANSALKNIGFEPHHDNIENAIFDNIEKFDLDKYLQSREHVSTVIGALKDNEFLNYKSGNIGEITGFCRQILKTIDNVKIAISTGDSNLGDINILRNREYEEPLTSSDKTRQILNKQREKAVQKLTDEKKRLAEEEKAAQKLTDEKKRLAEDDKKRSEGEGGESKITQGVILIKDGLSIKKKAGYTDPEIEYDIKRINGTISGKLLSEETGEDQKTKVVFHVKDTKVIAIVGITMLTLGILIGTFAIPYLSEKGIITTIKDKIFGPGVTEIPVTVPTIANNTSLTPEKTPVPTVNNSNLTPKETTYISNDSVINGSSNNSNI